MQKKMQDEPQIDEVLKNIYDLYCNPDISKKEPASKYLATLQDSVSLNRHASTSLANQSSSFSFSDTFMENFGSLTSAKNGCALLLLRRSDASQQDSTLISRAA